MCVCVCVCVCVKSAKDSDLSEEETLDSLTLFTLSSYFIHRFWESLVRQIFPATNLIAETYPQFKLKIPETLHYIYDSNWFRESFITITEVPSEIIQKLAINHNNIEINNAKNQPFTFTNIPEITKPVASPIENMNTIAHIGSALNGSILRLRGKRFQSTLQ